MKDVERKVKERFGNECSITGTLDGGKKTILSDGEYEYVIATDRELYATSLKYDNMTDLSRRKYWQSKFPDNIQLINIFKEGNRDPELLFFDTNINETFLLPFKYEMTYFLSYYENFLKFKIFRKTPEEIVSERYGDGYVILNPDENRLGNFIITDGTYCWSVTSNPFRKTGLIQKTMTKESLIKYSDSRFPDYLNVIDINERPNGYKTFKIIDLRTKKEFNFSYEANKQQIVSVIENVYNHNKIYVDKCIEKYGDTFLLDKIDYVNCLHDIIVGCRVHGEITINAGAFLYANKYGCPQCGISQTGFRRSNFIGYCKNKLGLLYLIEMYNENERFVKIGITSHSVKRRFISKNIPYEYIILAEFKSDGATIYDKEKELHRYFAKEKYKPLISFGGETECFDISIKQKAISLIEELLVSLPDEIHS